MTPSDARPSRAPRVVWSLRTTLTLTIAGLFIVATGTVLAVQVAVVTRVLDQQVRSISVGLPPDGGVGVGGDDGGSPPAPADEAEVCVSEDGTASSQCAPPTSRAPDPAGVVTDVHDEVTTLRDSFTGVVVTGAVLVFLVFCALALVIARVVATRTTRRITAITELADALDPDDPSARVRAPSRADEIGQLTDTLNRALDRIESTLTAQKQFIANASHELLTPIAAIETSLDAPLSQGRFPQAVRPAVDRALAANRRAAALVRSLLQLARAQGVARAARHEVDLARLADEAVDEVRVRARQRGIVVGTDGLRPLTVTGDPVLLGLAVRNLVDNAVTHNVEGGRLDVATGAGAAPGSGSITVTNSTGPATGIGTGDVTDLVQPFHRGDGSRVGGAPGHGVGLAVVEAVVRAHAGHLELSWPGASTFRAVVHLDDGPGLDRLAGQSEGRAGGRDA